MRMEFLKAVKIADENKHLVGKIVNGMKIDEILIVPTNSEEYKEYMSIYLRTFNAQQSIVPFIDSDVQIRLLGNKHLIRDMHTLMTISIENAIKELNNQ